MAPKMDARQGPKAQCIEVRIATARRNTSQIHAVTAPLAGNMEQWEGASPPVAWSAPDTQEGSQMGCQTTYFEDHEPVF